MIFLFPINERKKETIKTINQRGVMKNVETVLEGNILTIKIDLSKEFGLSSSGKTIIVASSEGNQTIPGTDVKLGLNVYKYPPRS